MKCKTVVVYNLRMCMMEDNPGHMLLLTRNQHIKYKKPRQQSLYLFVYFRT